MYFKNVPVKIKIEVHFYNLSWCDMVDGPSHTVLWQGKLLCSLERWCTAKCWLWKAWVKTGEDLWEYYRLYGQQSGKLINPRIYMRMSRVLRHEALKMSFFLFTRFVVEQKLTGFFKQALKEVLDNIPGNRKRYEWCFFYSCCFLSTGKKKFGVTIDKYPLLNCICLDRNTHICLKNTIIFWKNKLKKCYGVPHPLTISQLNSLTYKLSYYYCFS